jgi:hypothetical protein
MNYIIKTIKHTDYYEWFTKIHYAHRIPPVSYAFGLYDNNTLIGVCSYGVPASSPLRAGLAGKEYECIVLELNRLVLSQNKKNQASYFISRTLKMLPNPSIVVSYADKAMNHTGYVYQACNFIYTGLSAKRTDWMIKGFEHMHGQTIADMSRGIKDRANYMRETYGDAFYLKERSRKHRYIYVVAKKAMKREIIQKLKYSIEPYPKEESMRYEINNTASSQSILFA